MARKLRVEEAGGLYHVINRGNYRQPVFAEAGAKAAFEKALFEACQRAGWQLHAFCIMNNHFHLALETPQENLSEGMRWLQATFANRFNRFRKESGRLFQGRFRSLAVEDSQRLAWLCHYIHLNPVRAGICPVEALGSYRWGSYWYLRQEPSRPPLLSFEACLSGAGELKDTRAGWGRYERYLAWLSEDEPARKQMEFERMSRGWAIGTKSFRRALVEDEKRLRAIVKLSQKEAREARELVWESRLEAALRGLEKGFEEMRRDRKSAAWKVAVAAWLKEGFGCTNRWLGERLGMGVEFGVSRYVAEMQAGKRPDAAEVYRLLTTKIK